MLKDGLYQFVPHHRVEEFEANGWTVVDDLSGTSHGVYSVTMFKPVVDAEPRDKQSE